LGTLVITLAGGRHCSLPTYGIVTLLYITAIGAIGYAYCCYWLLLRHYTLLHYVIAITTIMAMATGVIIAGAVTKAIAGCHYMLWLVNMLLSLASLVVGCHYCHY